MKLAQYLKKDLTQETIASGILVGKKTSSTWINNDEEFNAIDAKEHLYFILSDLGLSLDNLVVEKSEKIITTQASLPIFL